MRVLICENKEGKRLIKAQGEEMGLEDWKETKHYDLDRTAQMISYGQCYTIHRSSNQSRLQWWATINRQRSEQNMLNRFKETFGDPTQVVIGYGNWCPSRNMRHQPPFMRKGLRQLFQEAGYLVVLVDEFRTSAQCYHCREGKCEKFLKWWAPSPSETKKRVEDRRLFTCIQTRESFID